MSKYMTRQRKTLLDFLNRHADELLSVQKIADALESQDVSRSAVYRNVAELEAEGKLRRDHAGDAREVYYRYVGATECRDRVHLSCKKCGRTFHMDSGGADALTKVVEKAEGFSLDRSDTVLYGVCALCQDGDENMK